MINENELDEWLLGELSNGRLTSDHIMQGWLEVVGADAEVAILEAVERLRRDDKIKSNPDGTWQLRTSPVVVAEVPGDPNFRRGGRR